MGRDLWADGDYRSSRRAEPRVGRRPISSARHLVECLQAFERGPACLLDRPPDPAQLVADLVEARLQLRTQAASPLGQVKVAEHGPGHGAHDRRKRHTCPIVHESPPLSGGPGRRNRGRPPATAGVRGAHPGPGRAGWASARRAGAAAEDGPPSLDLDRERGLQAFIREAIARGLVESCQDVSGGGLAVAIAEMAAWGGRGATLRVGVGGSPAVALFGESPSRLVVEAVPRHVPALVLLARHHGLPAEELGTTGGERLVIELAGEGATGAAEERGSRIADAVEVRLADIRHAWEHGLPRALGWESLERGEGGAAEADHAAEAALPGSEVAG